MKPALSIRLSHMLTLAPDAVTDPEIARHFRRNFLVTVMDMTTWNLGSAFISPSTILPVFATHLTDSTIILGLIPALLEFGLFLPPMFVAPYVERMPRKYPWVLLLGVVERIPYLLLPLLALWLSGLSESMAVPALIGIVAWMAVGSGIVTTPWQEMVAKVIPVTHRGRLYGTGYFMGQLLSIGAASAAAAVLAAFPYPHNFVASFAIGTIGIVVSLLFLVFTVEPSRPVQTSLSPTYGHYLRRVRQILRSRPNYRRYISSRWLIQLGRMPLGFMAIFAVQRFQFPDSSAAIFTGILAASGMVGYAFWGTIGDRWGHKRVLELATGVWLIALLAALLVSILGWEWGVYLAFALMGLSNAGNLISSANLPLEFGPESERPTYIGLTRTAIGPVLLIAPLLGGGIIQVLSYPLFFAVSLAFTLGGLLLLVRGVKEPRYHPAQP
ncbi:MAG: MFS transporter [Anaerolineae bacterium]|nr:MFS transporter [Anaerolineae bacterium]